ncbi:MAG: hypothetical protein RIR11_3897 [Bacteroidota bacterium]|jgi:hypothetical protein
MNKKILQLIFCLVANNCFAIDYYSPGDSLWVWAKGGLNIRATPNDTAKIIGRVTNSSLVVVLEGQDKDYPYSIEVIKRSAKTGDSEKGYHPNFKLNGYWAKINHNGIVGYVFDGYLSKLPTFIGHQNDEQREDDFHVLALKKRNKLLKQIGQNKYDQQDYKFVRYIFGNGSIIDITGESGSWRKEMLFPDDLSLIEGYLIYAHTMKMETDTLLEKGDDYLVFEVEMGVLTIKKVGSFLILYESHSC